MKNQATNGRDSKLKAKPPPFLLCASSRPATCKGRPSQAGTGKRKGKSPLLHACEQTNLGLLGGGRARCARGKGFVLGALMHGGGGTGPAQSPRETWPRTGLLLFRIDHLRYAPSKDGAKATTMHKAREEYSIPTLGLRVQP